MGRLPGGLEWGVDSTRLNAGPSLRPTIGESRFRVPPQTARSSRARHRRALPRYYCVAVVGSPDCSARVRAVRRCEVRRRARIVEDEPCSAERIPQRGEDPAPCGPNSHPPGTGGRVPSPAQRECPTAGREQPHLALSPEPALMRARPLLVTPRLVQTRVRDHHPPTSPRRAAAPPVRSQATA